MRYFFVFFTLLFQQSLQAQLSFRTKGQDFDGTEKYVSLNFLSAAESQFAFGPSFGLRFSKRSEVFVEANYVAQSPFYGITDYTNLRGTRLVLEYRYLFVQNVRPLLGLIKSIPVKRFNSFVGVHGMLKPVTFQAKENFVNAALRDTLTNYAFRANAVTAGFAVIFGAVYDLSSNKKWKLEVNLGIGGKDRKVKVKSAPAGYQLQEYMGDREWVYIAPLHEESSGVYIPVGLRVRYMLE